MSNKGLDIEGNDLDSFSSSGYRALKNISTKIQNNIDNNFQDNASVLEIQKEIENAMKMASQQMCYGSQYKVNYPNTKQKRGKIS